MKYKKALIMVDILDKDIVRMKAYLEGCVKKYMSLLQDLSYYSIDITKGLNNEDEFRVALYYEDIKKGRDIIQPRVKEIMKELFSLDKIKLERCYEATSKNEQTLYEILYEIPEDIYRMVQVLSKIKKTDTIPVKFKCQ